MFHPHIKHIADRSALLAVLALSLILGANLPENALAKNPVDYVDSIIGTGREGKTFPGAATPGGMVQLSPDTITMPPGVAPPGNGFPSRSEEHTAELQSHSD